LADQVVEPREMVAVLAAILAVNPVAPEAAAAQVVIAETAALVVMGLALPELLAIGTGADQVLAALAAAVVVVLGVVHQIAFLANFLIMAAMAVALAYLDKAHLERAFQTHFTKGTAIRALAAPEIFMAVVLVALEPMATIRAEMAQSASSGARL